ncbi:DNA damage-induced apoptosis suppressor protein isoform X1 [Pseudophryne corroboree]|uniref:DNA damage-induced apoptosis suppressor protein isoform X1 n=1 Tax=Pseudophryne corroboree TaxID=495146 RepID=UPI003081AD0F
MNGTKRLLVGTVLSIQNSSFTYPACPDCFSRLIRTSSRYQCQRCGGTCKVAIHRYKLCVKVAEDQKLHIITVFGRCLEKVFGASADFLHRHLLGSVQLPAPLESGRAQELLLQAAEYCLIGRSFIFSVKIPGDLGRGDSVSLSDSCRNIVACQIILPNDDPIGCTVINHFNHLVESGLSNSLTNARAETSADTTLSDSSDLGFSDGSYSLSQSRNLFADYWQQSLGLSPSPLVSALAESALCDCRQCRCNRPEQLSHRAEHISQDNTVFVRRQINPPEDILTTTPCSIRCTSTPRSTHSSLRTSRSANGMRYCKPQSASRVQKMDFGQESYLQNICNSGGCRSQDGSGDGEQLLPQHVTAAETYQGQDGTWEDFPFSESLSKLIAGIESSEGTRSPFCVTGNEFCLITKMEGKRFRERFDSIKTPDVLLPLPAEKSEHGTVMEDTVRFGLDGSKTLVLSHSCDISKTDDNHSPFEQRISPSSHLQRSLEESREPDYISRDLRSTSPAPQDSSVTPQCTCPTRNGNGFHSCTEDKGSVIMVNVSQHPIMNINTYVISLGQDSFSSLRGNGINCTWQDVDLGVLNTNVLNDRDHNSEVYNASSDLFDTSNNTEGTLAVVPHPHCTETLERLENQMNKQYLKYTYCRRPSHTNTCYLTENRDIADKDWDFVPYLQSTPALRRLSGANCIAGDGWPCNNTSNAKSSLLSIGRKSHGSVTKFLLQKTRPSSSECRSTLFCAVADNFPLLYSPVSASFPNSQVSRLRTLKQRSTMSVCKSTRRKRILANKENCSVQSYLNRPNNETGRTVIESGCMIANRGEMDKYNAQGNIAHLSPVVCSSQQPEFQFSPIQTHLPSDWSPELFSENSNVCRQRDDLQRRLF